jgi:DNA repair protein RecN (Recombination protein N)
MLTELIIRNFIIVDQLALTFSRGMSVITGETGAGKSLLLDALEFVAGTRTQSSVIREGKEECDISAVFEVGPHHPAWLYLQSLDFAVDENIILRRVLNKEGRSKVYINQQPVTLAQLKAVGLLLLDWMGQHEHQHFLKSEVQLTRLDQYAGCHAQREQVKRHYLAWKQVADEYKAAEAAAAASAEERAWKHAQLTELSTLNLSAEELTVLDQEHKKLSSIEALLSLSAALINEIKEADSNLLSVQAQAGRRLQNLADEYAELASASNLWQEARVLMEEALRDVQHFHESLSADPERLQVVDARLALLHATARKYHLQPEALFDFYQTLAGEVSGAGAADVLEQLRLKAAALQTTYVEAAKALSATRQPAAVRLQEKVSELMKSLGMPKGECQIILETDATVPREIGIDVMQFRVKINPGQPFASLKEVASGGELSRIALIVAVLTTEQVEDTTLIFDEVDVGVSGAVASQVGSLIRRLSKNQQILCITHLPQVAKEGDHHLKIVKQFTDTTTFTEATWLSQEERVYEIARMLSGESVTESALAHVREELQRRM